MQSVQRFLFGPTQEERVRGVQSQLRSEQRVLDREIRSLDQASNKTKAEAKRLAKKGDTKNARMLAKEIAMGRHRRERLVVGKARMNSIQLQLQQQVAMYKVTGAMQKSSEVMKLSNQLIKLPQLQQSMRMMSQEMMKAGIMEEMMGDTLESSLGDDQEELEAEADDEVDKIMFEITDGKLGQATSTANLGSLEAPEPAEAEQEPEDMERMQAALEGLLKG